MNALPRTLSCLLLVLWLVVPYASAQRIVGHGSTCRNGNKSNCYRDEYQGTNFNEPLGIPGLPIFLSGGKMVSGVCFQRAKAGPCYNMRFSVQASPEEIYSYYYGLFQARPWLLDKKGSSERSLSAVDKDRNLCQVNVLSSYRCGRTSITDYLIVYKAVR